MSNFFYPIYIGTTPEKLWKCLQKPDSTRAFWMGHWHETSWEKGAPWRMMIGEGKIGHSGKILEIDKPQRLVIHWRCEILPELMEEGYSRITLQIEPVADLVRLTVKCENDLPESKFIARVSIGWPKILSSLKSLLETGAALKIPHG